MAFLNPSLAYGLTFYCPGFTFTEYSVVYWLGPIFGKSNNIFVTYKHLIKKSLSLTMRQIAYQAGNTDILFSGMTLALLLYMGHIPRIFTKNLLYSEKTRFRVPKGEGDKRKWKNIKIIHLSWGNNRPKSALGMQCSSLFWLGCFIMHWALYSTADSLLRLDWQKGVGYRIIRSVHVWYNFISHVQLVFFQK